MQLLVLLLAVTSVSATVTSFECYPVVGCLSNEWPWSGPSRAVPPPNHPLNVSTKMLLYTRDADDSFPIFPDVNFGNISISTSKPTFLLFHSYMLNATSTPILSMKDAILGRVDGNVLIPVFNNQDSYNQTVSNARVVARLVANTLDVMGVNISDVHFIGTQMGGQIAGLAAKAIFESRNLVGRITALDPPGHLFENLPEEARLDWADADYVDVIHTNAGSYGHLEPMGDVDFYINGGRIQPACRNETNFNICSHWMSIDYYLEAIETPCLFGVPALITEDISGAFLDIQPSMRTFRRAPLGLDKVDPGVYYVTTAPTIPFCNFQNNNIKIAPF